MKTSFKGFTISIIKTGDDLNYSVYRNRDSFEVISGVSYDGETLQEFTKHLKGVVNDFIKDPTAYETTFVDYGDDLPPEDLDSYNDQSGEMEEE